MYSDIQEFSSNAAPGRPEQDEEGPVETGPVPSGELGTGTGEGDRTNKSGPDVDAASLETDAQQPSEDSAAAPEVLASSLGIQMLGLAGEAIAGLAVRVAVDGEVQDLLTDEEGALPQIRALAGMKLEISVQRFDGSFKLIDSGLMPSGNSQWGFVSPKSVFDIETTAHEGEAGEAEQSVPTPLPADKGLEPDTAHEEAAHALPMPGEPQKTASIEPAQGVSAKAVAPGSTRPSAPAQPLIRPRPAALAAPAAPAASRPPPSSAAVCQAQPPRQVIPPKISGKVAPPAPALPRKSGRDAEGKPLLVIAVQKVTDWWNSWRLPTSGIFGSRTSGAGARSSIGTPNKSSRPPSAAAGCTPVGAVAFDPSMVDTVAALLQFAEEQTQYAYTPGTAAVLASLAKGTFKHEPGEKISATSKGMCYQYVKIALSRCEIVEGYVADKSSADMQESASKAGPALIEKGFVDVTDEVPDARWAAAGDVIVYAWSDETWADRRKKKKQPSLPNHGHIDIRGVEGYLSDFMPEANHPQWVVPIPNQKNRGLPNYVNVKIYRKVFDPLPVCRMRAFLRCLREFECQQYKTDDEKYTALQSSLPGNPKSRRFTSFATHPWEPVPDDQRPASTASGAYQIQRRTWEYVLNMGHCPDLVEKPLFSPHVQDRIAVILIERRDALHLIRAGRIAEATSRLRNEWTSLPGAAENANRMSGRRPMDMNFLLERFQSNLSDELKKAGVV